MYIFGDFAYPYNDLSISESFGGEYAVFNCEGYLAEKTTAKFGGLSDGVYNNPQAFNVGNI
jgi:hypothetical protein